MPLSTNLSTESHSVSGICLIPSSSKLASRARAPHLFSADPQSPAIRVCAAGAALLTIFCIGLFSTRYSVTLFAHAGLSPNTTGAETQDPFDGEYVPTSAALIAPLPMVGWMIITTIVFSKMGRYLRAALGQPPADFDRGSRPDARSGGAHTEMVSSSTSAAKGPSTYAVGAARSRERGSRVTARVHASTRVCVSSQKET